MTQPKGHLPPLGIEHEVVLLDDCARSGTQAARRMIQKVWLSMCLGSVVSLTFILATTSIL